jgi:hypothetical protein
MTIRPWRLHADTPDPIAVAIVRLAQRDQRQSSPGGTPRRADHPGPPTLHPDTLHPDTLHPSPLSGPAGDVSLHSTVLMIFLFHSFAS